ncbi:hypothetical protein Q3G72_016182 [Acer saccharum]|nr:hypothetical protein Q3G72_016182 [Acer saccharum]
MKMFIELKSDGIGSHLPKKNIETTSPIEKLQQPEKERKEEKKRKIVVDGLAESVTPLVVGADAFARRHCLQLPSDVAVAAALVRRSCCFCSSMPSPLLVNAVALTH